ncbi:MAG TPA: benzoate-CoA ligase family protein [Streptosporangiaceae bacterium]|nr:benzoate-CoA ligase family protein [Streptosporangiaceae bacterium]
MDLSPSAHVDTFARDHLPPAELWPTMVHTLPELRYPSRLNCAEELLDRTVERFGPDRPCLIGQDESWTYGELLRRANQVARVLTEDLGVVPGNRVLLRGPNNPWLVACWLGVIKAGAVAVAVLPVLRAGELAEIATKARVSHALCDSRFADDLVKADVDGLRILGYGGKDGDDLIARCAGKPADFAAVPTAADDVCMIAFTSGTTGKPKGCLHFHRDVLAIADTFAARVLRPRPDDVFAGSPPLSFTFGLGGLVVFPLRAGASSVLLERGSPQLLLAALAEHRVSVLFTAPTAYRAMLAEPGGPEAPALRRCVSAGEHLNARTWEAWREATGVEIIDGIGSTEMLHIFISSADADIRPGSTGRVVPGYEARVVDDAGDPVPDGRPGLLAVRGPTGCRYLADDRQREYVRGGWNFTGDVYIRDADGYYWYQSRADDLIISAGYNIAAVEVEEALLRSPVVAEAAVIGVPDAERGQVVKAFVVLRDGVPATDATAASLQEFVKAEIAPYKYPRAVAFLDALPYTPTGKLQRFKLRDHPG